jgi:hypothetical protein
MISAGRRHASFRLTLADLMLWAALDSSIHGAFEPLPSVRAHIKMVSLMDFLRGAADALEIGAVRETKAKVTG